MSGHAGIPAPAAGRHSTARRRAGSVCPRGSLSGGCSEKVGIPARKGNTAHCCRYRTGELTASRVAGGILPAEDASAFRAQRGTEQERRTGLPVPAGEAARLRPRMMGRRGPLSLRAGILKGGCPCRARSFGVIGPASSGERNEKGEGESLRRGERIPLPPDGHARIQAAGRDYSSSCVCQPWASAAARVWAPPSTQVTPWPAASASTSAKSRKCRAVVPRISSRICWRASSSSPARWRARACAPRAGSCPGRRWRPRWRW